MRKRTRSTPPHHTVANVFIISRVPESGEIQYESLIKSINKDVESASDEGLDITKYFNLSIDAQIRSLVRRSLLSIVPGDGSFLMSDSKVRWNERTSRYMRRAHRGAHRVVSKVPVSNALLLLAGISEG